MGEKMNDGMMWALVKEKPEEGLWMKRVPIPEVGPNDVKIKIHKTAICGTDVHICRKKYEKCNQKMEQHQPGKKNYLWLDHRYRSWTDCSAGIRNFYSR